MYNICYAQTSNLYCNYMYVQVGYQTGALYTNEHYNALDGYIQTWFVGGVG